MSDYETNQAAAEEALRPRLTDEFLSTLVQAVRTVGHSVDYVESIALVQEVFAIAGKKSPKRWSRPQRCSPTQRHDEELHG